MVCSNNIRTIVAACRCTYFILHCNFDLPLKKTYLPGMGFLCLLGTRVVGFALQYSLGKENKRPPQVKCATLKCWESETLVCCDATLIAQFVCASCMNLVTSNTRLQEKQVRERFSKLGTKIFFCHSFIFRRTVCHILSCCLDTGKRERRDDNSPNLNGRAAGRTLSGTCTHMMYTHNSVWCGPCLVL